MYKVLLVDDEPWVLTGIRKTFGWKKYGFEIIGEITKSEEALEIILKSKPDVVFTDIRMPKISGIELMKRVREAGLDTVFIVVSGFGEFTYAQQAMQQGAFDYCLKPLELDYADKLMQKLCDHLKSKKQYDSMGFYEAILESSDIDPEKLIKCGLGTSCRYYQALVALSPLSEISDADHLFSGEINKIRINLGRHKQLYFFNTDKDISSVSDTQKNNGMSIGISSLSDSMENISRLNYEADISANSYFLYDEYRAYTYKKKDHNTVSGFINKFAAYVEEKKQEELKNLVQSIPEFFMDNNLTMEDAVYLWNQAAAILIRLIYNEGPGRTIDFMDYKQMTNQFESIRSYTEYLLNEVSDIIEEQRDGKDIQEYSNSDFNRILSYIREHYQEQLYLRDIAGMFYMKSNHCCNLFKKYTGSTYSDYLNNLRIEKSKQILENANLTIEEVAQEAGYNDYYYFIKLFKKLQGITPTQYRKEILHIR